MSVHVELGGDGHPYAGELTRSYLCFWLPSPRAFGQLLAGAPTSMSTCEPSSHVVGEVPGVRQKEGLSNRKD